MEFELIRQRISDDGFTIVEPGLPAADCEKTLRAASEMTLEPGRGGIRNLLSRPWVRDVAAHVTIVEIVRHVLGECPIPIKATLFDKTPAANWKVALHQDLSLPLSQREDRPGWGPWSTKAGVLHAQAPAAVLARVVAVRLHLDAATDANGPLCVIPGSHLAGRLSATDLKDWRRAPQITCLVARGGLLLMRPLLLHASSQAAVPDRRRILHIEYAGESLLGEFPELLFKG